MKLITLNTWQGRLSRNFAPFFNQQAADIVCLQELHSSDVPIPTFDFLQNLQVITQASGLEHVFYAPTYSYDVLGKEAAFGNGILSRYPISTRDTVFTQGEFAKVTAESLENNTRNIQIAHINTPEGMVTVVNHHGHWGTEPLGSELTLERMKKLTDVVRNIEGPLIIAGDMNVWGHSDTLRHLKDSLGLRSLTEEFGIQNTLNNLLTPHEVACDHVLVSNQVNVMNYWVDEALLSDHKALILEFSL
jgi:endonuclease/exonuclease/phosphatase family metal-dependent hydrolase